MSAITAAAPRATSPITSPVTSPVTATSETAADRDASPNRILAAALFGFFLVGLDALVVTVALPAISHSLSGGMAGLQWVVDGYTLAFAALMLSSGALSDRVGADRAYKIGLIGFTAASVACGVAPNLGLLIAARLVQGTAASVMLPASLALVRQAFPEVGARAKAIAIWTAAGSSAAAAGPVAGGAITSALSWRAIFFLNVPAGILALYLLAKAPRSPRQATHFDLAGLVTSVLTLAGLTYAVIEGGAKGFDSTPVLASLGVAAGSATAFLVAESRRDQPMVPLYLFRSRAVSLTALAGFSVNAAFYGAIFALSLYFQQVLHLSALTTGWLFMPMTAIVTVVNLTVAARMVARIGARLSITIGLVGTAVAMVSLLGVRPGLPTPVLVLFLVPIAFAGSFAVPALTMLLMGSVPVERAGTAAGIVNTARQVGGALAVAAIGALVSSPGSFASGMHAGLIGIAVLLLVAAVAVQTLLPADRRVT